MPDEFTMVADAEEAFAMLNLLARVFNPEGLFARVIPKALDVAMHAQQDEMFESQGNGTWPGLSEWRMRDRDGSAGPILQDTGQFRAATSEFVGMWSATTSSFSYIYPGLFQEEAGKYFGITAGQRKNPLAKNGQGPIPMKQVPRPILFGQTRMYADVNMVLREFLAEAGMIGIGITGFGGEE